MHRTAVELPLTADRSDLLPLVGQIAAQLRDAVAGGVLGAGDRLPSSRALAASLGLSRTVVTSAYAQLYAEGWLEGRHGSGTYVAAVREMRPAAAGGKARPASAGIAAWPGPAASEARPEPPVIEMRPGMAWVGGIDLAAWRRAWRRAGSALPALQPDRLGLPALRAAVGGYLRRSRGVRCSPEQVLITRGVAGSLHLLAAAVLRPGDLVGVEEPGYPAARAVFAAHGARVVPCRADEHGLVVGELPAGLRLVYTTPAHQYPLGGRLPVPRRQALTAWARAAGALIVEDDYDSEFRYDVEPLPALFGLDPEIVVYLGTTAKTLASGFGVGWLVASPGLAASAARAASDLGDRTSEVAQRALLALISGGDLERHVRRMRREYARRREAIVAALGGLPGARLLGDTAGLHVVLTLPSAAAADELAEQALRRGVAVMTLERFFSGPATRHGLVLGYGSATLPQITRACGVLSEILAGSS
jgi:GntR family transcriptional regulator / MocR family aminotransferase